MNQGVIFTKREVAQQMLTCLGNEKNGVFLEPSCGNGIILEEALKSRLASGLEISEKTFVGFEIHPGRAAETRKNLARILAEAGLPDWSNQWIRTEDFLAANFGSQTFDFIVGNPPYIKLNCFDKFKQHEYREKFKTLFAKTDIYIAFFERCLDLLSPEGMLVLLVPDRWLYNHYGKRLRQKIARDFYLQRIIKVSDPFESTVEAYPAVFVISRTFQHPTEIQEGFEGMRFEVSGDEPWAPQGAGVTLETFAKVGIGLTTGCDEIFIFDEPPDIEPSRVVPLVLRKKTCYTINTFEPNGALIVLDNYPKLSSYLRRHESKLRNRYVAKKNPLAWFRTCDKIDLSLIDVPKLLFPDIAKNMRPFLHSGAYPHHNLYYVISNEWDLEVLGAILSSSRITQAIQSRSPRMRGGYFRCQAQFLKQLRIPSPLTLSLAQRDGLANAFRESDYVTVDKIMTHL